MSRLDWIPDWAERARRSGYTSKGLAKLCSVSPSQLRRFFNEVCRCPPQQWLDELRLWHAMEMLCNGCAVKNVAATLNFSSASHFCHRFKQYHGCTPVRCAFIYHERTQRFERSSEEADREAAASQLQPWKEAERKLLKRLCGSSISRGRNDAVWQVGREKYRLRRSSPHRFICEPYG